MSDLHETTSRALHRLVVDRQRDGGAPGVFAGVLRGGGLAWSTGVGAKLRRTSRPWYDAQQ